MFSGCYRLQAVSCKPQVWLLVVKLELPVGKVAKRDFFWLLSAASRSKPQVWLLVVKLELPVGKVAKRDFFYVVKE